MTVNTACNGKLTKSRQDQTGGEDTKLGAEDPKIRRNSFLIFSVVDGASKETFFAGKTKDNIALGQVF